MLYKSEKGIFSKKCQKVNEKKKHFDNYNKNA